MQLTDFLSPRAIASGVELNSKKRALELVSELIAAQQSDLTASEVFESLVARERLGSTGLGHGVAIPHARLKGLDRTLCAFMRLNKGIDYDAIDGQPVDLICALLVPQQSTEAHLELLSALAEMFSDGEFCHRLRTASGEEQLQELLAHWHPINAQPSTATR